jgi:hypothetical protein
MVLVVQATMTMTALRRAVRQRDHVGRSLSEPLVGRDKPPRDAREADATCCPLEKMLLPHLR